MRKIIPWHFWKGIHARQIVLDCIVPRAAGFLVYHTAYNLLKRAWPMVTRIPVVCHELDT
jgi:hypothetical protein